MRGQKSPLLLAKKIKVISEKYINQLVEEKIGGTNCFLVDLSVSGSNAITVEIDSADGVKISDCVELSRYIENNLDREEEDFELSVTSAGIGRPFKVFKQYEASLGKEVEVLLNNGEKLIGELKEVSPDEISIGYSKKVKIEGKKKKELVYEQKKLSMGEIKETKIIVSFK